MTDEERLQKYLPLIRNAAGWTAEELGQKIGVTKQTISNIENYKTKMSKTQYLAIQMVISQKIATTTDDLTLANIMQMIFEMDEEEVIDYSAVEHAKNMALRDIHAWDELDEKTSHSGEQNDSTADTNSKSNSANEKESGSMKNAIVAGGIAGAMSILGLNPISAVSAAVLGATVLPWLNRAVGDEEDD